MAAIRSLDPEPAPQLQQAAAHTRHALADLAYQLIALPATVLAFASVLGGVIVAVVLGITIVGAPVALAVFAMLRAHAELERRRAAVAFGAPLMASYRPRRGGLFARLGTALADPQSRRDLAWLTFAGTLGFAASVAVVTM